MNTKSTYLYDDTRPAEADAAHTSNDTPPDTQNTIPIETLDQLDSVSETGDWVPFPVERLPRPIRDLVNEGAAAIGCDPVYIALACLAVCAAAIGNTRRLQIKRTWNACHVIWAVFVGESGTMKTPAFQLAMAPLNEYQTQMWSRYESHLAAFKVELERCKREKTESDPDRPNEKPDTLQKPTAQRCIVKNTTVESLIPILKENWRGVLLALDELSGWFGSFNRYVGKGNAGGDESFWLSSYNCEDAIVDRKTGVPPTLFVRDAAVCVLGGIQPGVLARAMNPSNRESGLAARLLMVAPPRRPKQWTELDVAESTLSHWDRTVRQLLVLEPDFDATGSEIPELIRLTPEAKLQFINFFTEHNQEQVKLTGDMAAAWSKLEEYAARIALVFHIVQCLDTGPTKTVPRQLEQRTMVDAIAVTQWFKAEARRVYGLLDGNSRAECVRELLEFIRNNGGSCSGRELMTWNRKQYQTADAAEAALKELVRLGHGNMIVVKPEGGGRPSLRFQLKDLHNSQNSETPHEL